MILRRILSCESSFPASKRSRQHVRAMRGRPIARTSWNFFSAARASLKPFSAAIDYQTFGQSQIDLCLSVGGVYLFKGSFRHVGLILNSFYDQQQPTAISNDCISFLSPAGQSTFQLRIVFPQLLDLLVCKCQLFLFHSEIALHLLDLHVLRSEMLQVTPVSHSRIVRIWQHEQSEDERGKFGTESSTCDQPRPKQTRFQRSLSIR